MVLSDKIQKKQLGAFFALSDSFVFVGLTNLVLCDREFNIKQVLPLNNNLKIRCQLRLDNQVYKHIPIELYNQLEMLGDNDMPIE